MNDDFGVCFSCEDDALFDQFLLEASVIFDNAVMHNSGFVCGMGMSVTFIGQTMGRPTCMADTDCSY